MLPESAEFYSQRDKSLFAQVFLFTVYNVT